MIANINCLQDYVIPVGIFSAYVTCFPNGRCVIVWVRVHDGNRAIVQSYTGLFDHFLTLGRVLWQLNRAFFKDIYVVCYRVYKNFFIIMKKL